MTPRGRRPGAGSAREDILGAARDLFAERGLDATSVRAIAERAGVDPALLYRFYGSKLGVFEATLTESVHADAVFELDVAQRGAGHELVRRFVRIWNQPTMRQGWLGIFRTAVASSRGRDLLAQLAQRVIVRRLVSTIAAPEAERRAALIASQMAGLVLTRYLLEVEPLSALSDEEIVRFVGPVIEHYLHDPL